MKTKLKRSSVVIFSCVLLTVLLFLLTANGATFGKKMSSFHFTIVNDTVSPIKKINKDSNCIYSDSVKQYLQTVIQSRIQNHQSLKHKVF